MTSVTEGCWEFQGKRRDGYGVIKLGRRHTATAHRVTYEAMVGPIPSGLQLDHLCRVRHCVRPDHLEPVTQRENILRGEGVAAREARQTHCKNGHEFTPENTYRHPGGRRVCRTCSHSYQRDYRRRRAA